MNKQKLIKFVYILLRERLTFGDLEAIIAEVNSAEQNETLGLVQLYVEEIVGKLLSSGLKCYNNMCNTQDDDVKLVEWQGMHENMDGTEICAMCADCRRRNPQVVVVEK